LVPEVRTRLGNLPKRGDRPFVAGHRVGRRTGDTRVQQNARNRDEEHNDDGHQTLS
jgi:hypothetical protein